jgi:hypothetical protein
MGIYAGTTSSPKRRPGGLDWPILLLDIDAAAASPPTSKPPPKQTPAAHAAPMSHLPSSMQRRTEAEGNHQSHGLSSWPVPRVCTKAEPLAKRDRPDPMRSAADGGLRVQPLAVSGRRPHPPKGNTSQGKTSHASAGPL